MQEIVPFRALVYNQDRVGEISEVVTPPYDVISGEQQKAFYGRHPHNVIRLDKSLAKEGEDGVLDSQDAAACLAEWMAGEVLSLDPEPALYLASVEFPHKGKNLTRLGLFARVRLASYEQGVILRHEKTFSKTKTERLKLMKACGANFSPIFSLYPDETGVHEDLARVAETEKPFIDHADDVGHRHRVWRMAAPGFCRDICSRLAGETLFIADGHHRYETALKYRDELRESQGIGPDHPANFVMMYLASVRDPGLAILPTHRLVKGMDPGRLEALVSEAPQFFEVDRVSLSGPDPDAAKLGFISRLSPNGRPESLRRIGLVLSGQDQALVLSVKTGTMKRLFGDEMPQALRQLDVSVLTRLIFGHILGSTPGEMVREKRLSYTSSHEEAFGAVARGDAQAAFFLNPATNEQVCQVAAQGLTMPQKTTYYYPKVITGHVMNLLTV